MTPISIGLPSASISQQMNKVSMNANTNVIISCVIVTYSEINSFDSHVSIHFKNVTVPYTPSLCHKGRYSIVIALARYNAFHGLQFWGELNCGRVQWKTQMQIFFLFQNNLLRGVTYELAMKRKYVLKVTFPLLNFTFVNCFSLQLRGLGEVLTTPPCKNPC